MRFLPLAFTLLALAVVGCDGARDVASPAAFERPESVSFFCWNTAENTAVPLSSCTPMEDPPEGVIAGSPAEPFELHAAVTQTATGEVAAVQITGDADNPAGPIDSDVRVPGFTFAPVGDVPSAVVTPSMDPSYTYVVSRGSSDLHVVETRSFRGSNGARVRRARPDAPFFALDDGLGRPSAMVINADEDELIVAVPEAGEVWFLPLLGDGEVGDPVRVPLAPDLPAAVDLTTLPEGERPATYRVTCPSVPVTDPAPVPPRMPVSLGPAPRPWDLVLDEETGRVLVADRALPVIHVIDVETHTPLDAINVGTPTRALALTPQVPGSAGDNVRTDRFVYAIDDTDQSVLVVDYSDPARASFGAVLTVGPTAPQDRLAVPFPARAIEVVSPSWTVEGAIPECSDEAAPTALRGVFLAVGTVDGRVRFFDIYDLDAPCRTDACDSDAVAISRHRPRIGAAIVDPVSLDPEPVWDIDGLSANVDATTGSANGAVSTLERLVCPEGLGPVFGVAEVDGEEQARVCVVADPWAATSQQFVATWEGAIPNTTMTGANFVAGEPAIEVRFDPCALGVLGRGQELDGQGYVGDVVAITSPLPPSLSDEARSECQRIFDASATGEIEPILLPLVRASHETSRPTYPGRLEVDERALDGASLEDIRGCFPDLLEIEIRARDAFVVRSTRAGFRHPVVAGADGVCEVDPAALAANQRGRAFLGQVFRTPEIAFELQGEPTPGASLQIITGNIPVPYTIDVSAQPNSSTDFPSLITALEYNETDERLYVVEQARLGLMRFNLLTGVQDVTSFR